MMVVEPGDPDLDAEVEGSIVSPQEFYSVSYDNGTSAELYLKFLKHNFLTKLRDDRDKPQRFLMYGNLSSHKSDFIYSLLEKADHADICRPSYQPDLTPVEYMFDLVARKICFIWKNNNDVNKLMKELHLVINARIGMEGFDELFYKLGYKYDG